MKNTKSLLEWVISYLFYPVLFISTVALFALAYSKNWQLGRIHGYYSMGLIVSLILLELLYPLQTRWRMTWKLFLRRDLVFMIIGGVTLVAVNYVMGLIVVAYQSRSHAWITDLHPLIAFVISIYFIDFLWYWVHRLAHELPSTLGRVMWKIHVAHHLPQQVYVLMHGVAHPINLIVVRMLFFLPLGLAGIDAKVMVMVNAFVGMQGLVSHFNVDIRAGYFNYFFMGTELHRYHHSADPNESKNYGSTVTLWDQLFGTFCYKPGRVPERLGIEDTNRYPDSLQILRILKLPFTKT